MGVSSEERRVAEVQWRLMRPGKVECHCRKRAARLVSSIYYPKQNQLLTHFNLTAARCGFSRKENEKKKQASAEMDLGRT